MNLVRPAAAAAATSPDRHSPSPSVATMNFIRPDTNVSLLLSLFDDDDDLVFWSEGNDE